jgi:hypothetical protein
MKFTMIDEEKTHHSVSRMACVLGVSRAGYHAWEKRPDSAGSLLSQASGRPGGEPLQDLFAPAIEPLEGKNPLDARDDPLDLGAHGIEPLVGS